jgi:lysophospholipase L1-like esterase
MDAVIPRSARVVALVAVLATFLVPLRSASASSCGLQKKSDGVSHRSPYFTQSATWIYGDSITYQVWPELEERFPDASIDAYWGRRTTHVLDRIRQDVPRHVPKTVVVATGTNDRGDPHQFAGDVQRIRKWLPAMTRLIWVLIYVDTPPAWQDVDSKVLAVPRVEVVDWVTPNLQARGRGERSPLLYDGKHLNCRGASVWLDLVADALDPVPDVRLALPVQA